MKGACRNRKEGERERKRVTEREKERDRGREAERELDRPSQCECKRVILTSVHCVLPEITPQKMQHLS